MTNVKVYSNLRNYTLSEHEKSVDDLPFKWQTLNNVPSDAVKYGYQAVLIYAYIHSGIVYSLNPFFDKWDSGIAGVLLFPANAKNVRLKSKNFVNKLNKAEEGDDADY